MSYQNIIFYDEALHVLFTSEVKSSSEDSYLKIKSGNEDIAIIASNDFSFYKFDISQENFAWIADNKKEKKNDKDH